MQNQSFDAKQNKVFFLILFTVLNIYLIYDLFSGYMSTVHFENATSPVIKFLSKFEYRTSLGLLNKTYPTFILFYLINIFLSIFLLRNFNSIVAKILFAVFLILSVFMFGVVVFYAMLGTVRLAF